MKIEILGTGCTKCKSLHQLVQQALADAGVEAEVVKVENLDDIVNSGVPITPALVIDGTVKSAGALPKAAQVSVGVYDVSGRLVQSLADGEEMAAGPVSLRWQGRDSAGRAVASGTYLFRVQAGAIVRTERFTLVR